MNAGGGHKNSAFSLCAEDLSIHDTTIVDVAHPIGQCTKPFQHSGSPLYQKRSAPWEQVYYIPF